MIAVPVIDAVLNVGAKVIDKIWPDPVERDKAKLELLKLASEGEFKDLEARMSAIVAEAKSEHWITSAWRPLIMLTFGAIVANNYLLAPYTSLLFGVKVTLELPPQMWELLNLGIGGYVLGRSVEKALSTWKAKP